MAYASNLPAFKLLNQKVRFPLCELGLIRFRLCTAHGFPIGKGWGCDPPPGDGLQAIKAGWRKNLYGRVKMKQNLCWGQK